MLYSHGRIEILERFSDKYTCDEILGVYRYGRSNSVILKEAIKDYDKLDEAGQDKQILENFAHIKRVVDYSDEKLVDAIRNEEIKLYEYEYLLKMPGFSNITIALLVKYDVIKMINKSDWNMKDVTDIFRNRKKDVMQKIIMYTGDSDPKSKRNEKIFKRLYEEDTYTEDGKLKESAAEVNQINRYLQSDKKDYDCRVFFNEKPITIYRSEIDKLKEIKKRYRTNEKDGRRIVRLVCLLLAWQKAYQNQFYNHRLKPYARGCIDSILENNPIVEVNNRSDSVAMITDRKKLKEDGYIDLLLPEVYAPREVMPDLYYRLNFCVDESTAENEEAVLTITDFRNIWEQIFVAVFKEFDVLEEIKEKDIKHGEIREYDSKNKTGKVYIPDKDKTYSFSGSGKLNVGDMIDIYIMDSKKGKVKMLKKPNERVYVTYKAVKRCLNCGKMFYARQMGDGTGKCDVCNRR